MSKMTATTLFISGFRIWDSKMCHDGPVAGMENIPGFTTLQLRIIETHKTYYLLQIEDSYNAAF